MSDGPLSPEEVAHRGFGTTFRGFDTGEVRAYLQRVADNMKEAIARERELYKRVADAEYRATHPVLEGEALTRALGDEMGRVLASAQEAANGLKDKAEENAARILREAHEQAQRIRAQAEAILAVRTEEADAEAAEIRTAAATEAAALVERAGEEASAAMYDMETRARQLVHDAQAARARVLADLTRRRRLLQTQVEQLRAGRDRLLEAYRKVRSTTDEVAEELQRVEAEAREAAGAAGERLAAVGADDIDGVLAAFAPDTGVGRAESTAGESGTARAGTGSGDRPGEGPSPAAPVPFEIKAEVAAQLAGQGAEDAEAAAVAAEAAAVEAAEQAAGDERPPHQVSTRPGGERRPLRLLRRPKDGRPLDVVPTPSGNEDVRVVPPPPEPVVAAAAASRPAPEAVAPAREPPAVSGGTKPGTAVVGGGTEVTAPAGPGDGDTRPTADALRAPEREGDHEAGVVPAGHDAGGDSAAAGPVPAAPLGAASRAEAAAVAGVDELFARIRAGRAEAVARAHEVLAADPGGSSGPASDATAPEAAPESGGAIEEKRLLRRRDTAVEGLEARLARKLKRALQDEQNEVLDRLRSARAGAPPEAVLPLPREQADRFRHAADEPLRASAAAGMAFVVRPSDEAGAPDIADVVSELVASLAEPLGRALERAVRGDGGDQVAVGERIGAAYRECKAQRIEGLAGDAVTAAFSWGTLAALPAGAASRWVVDDGGRPCPDCDDNALAGLTPAGEAFPTGQAHPPAHAGCRCLLAPAMLAAAGPGDG